MPGRVHHTAICTTDVEASMRFYREGLGLDVLMDHEFEGDWLRLFGAPTTKLRSIMLGDAAHPTSGVVELVAFPEPVPEAAGDQRARQGLFLISFYVDLDAVLDRLGGLGFDEVVRIEVPGPAGSVPMASVRDPDGVLVELIGAASGVVPGSASGANSASSSASE